MMDLLNEISACRICAGKLPFDPRPVVQAGVNSKIIVIGQAPGRIVNSTGIPWNDKSGDNLRGWLGIDKSLFYDPNIFSLMPMGFCYPGTGKSGDLPPRTECAPQWHAPLMKQMGQAKLILLVGQYAQKYYLGTQAKAILTETVQNFETYLPKYFPLPHPSPRNNLWQAKNRWFEEKILLRLKNLVLEII